VLSTAASCSDDHATGDSHGDGGAGGGHGSEHGGGGSTSSGPGEGGGGGSSDGGEGGGANLGEPQPPNLTSVEPMDGGLHITWENVTPDCDAIELDRNQDGGAFATAYTVTGAAVDHHDTDVTPPSEYCYRARCIKADTPSTDSNELCGAP
jgi:hypothetical protein